MRETKSFHGNDEFYHAVRYVSDYALEYLRQNKSKMHQDDINNLEQCIKIIDRYGFIKNEK
jgi:hypothetical protein